MRRRLRSTINNRKRSREGMSVSTTNTEHGRNHKPVLDSLGSVGSLILTPRARSTIDAAISFTACDGS
jgi:hypothetical protein